jgi:pilus assembly protein CpaE
LTSAKIRVLIADDFADTRESISKLLYFERDIELVGTAPDGQQAIQAARELRPDVILMDINMPVMDGISATEAISSELPECSVIMMSVQGEADFLRRAMLVGAREYLVKPFTSDELSGSIRRVFVSGAEKRARLAAARLAPSVPQVPTPKDEKVGRIVALFSPKGGVGRTTIATNLAVALRSATERRVALVDFSLLFGDIAIMMNLPTSKTVVDLIPAIDALYPELLDSIMVEHASGVRVLLAPPRPELAELLTADHLRAILGLLRSHYDYVVIDTRPSFDDAMLAVLDLSDQIVALTTLEMPAVKNIRLFLEVAEALGYPPGKLMLVLNRADSAGGIRVEDIEQSIRFKVAASIVNAGQLMTAAVNQGVPVVMSNRDSQVSRDILELARLVMTEEDQAAMKGRENGAAASHEPQSRRGMGILRLPALGTRKGGG